MSLHRVFLCQMRAYSGGVDVCPRRILMGPTNPFPRRVIHVASSSIFNRYYCTSYICTLSYAVQHSRRKPPQGELDCSGQGGMLPFFATCRGMPWHHLRQNLPRHLPRHATEPSTDLHGIPWSPNLNTDLGDVDIGVPWGLP